MVTPTLSVIMISTNYLPVLLVSNYTVTLILNPSLKVTDVNTISFGQRKSFVSVTNRYSQNVEENP